MAKIRESVVIPGGNMGIPASGYDFNPWSVDAFNNGTWPYGWWGVTGVNPYSTAQQYDNGSGYFKQVYLTTYQLKQVRERARWLYAYNEFCIAVVNIFKNYVIGSGFSYKVTGLNDQVNYKLIDDAQNIIDLFCEKNNVQDMELEYIYRLLIEGEACCRIFDADDGILNIRWVENDLILPPNDSNDPDISFGIACRHDDLHDVKGYWIVTKPYLGLIPELIPVDEVNYDKVMTYSNNKRGLSTTFPVSQNFIQAEQILQAMVSLAISRSKVSLIRRLENSPPEAVAALVKKTTNVEVTNPYPGQPNLNLESLPNSSVLTSTANIEYEFPDIKLGSENSEITLMANLRAIAASYGISEAHLTQRLDGGSYAAHVVAESPSFKTFSRWQKKVGDFFASRRTKPHQSLMWKQISYAVKKGILPSNALTELKIVPTGPSLFTRDPLQEAQANKVYFDMGIKSANQIASEQGYEYDEQKKQKADDDGLENILKSVASIKSVGVTPEAGRKLMKQYHPVLPDDIINDLFSTSEADEIQQGNTKIKPEPKSVPAPKVTKGAKKPAPQQHNDDILKYLPLVKNIASYFFNVNTGVEIEDLYQEGFIGLLMAKKRYDPSKNVSLGAFAHRYIFGRIYRSLLGTKNLQYNKKIMLMDLPETIVDARKNTEEYMFELYDSLLAKYNMQEVEMLEMTFQNYKKCEIIKKVKVTGAYYDSIIIDFRNNFVI